MPNNPKYKNPKYKNLTNEDAHRLSTEDLGALVGFMISREMEHKKAKEDIAEGYPELRKGGKIKAKKKAKSRVNEAGNYTKPGLRKRIFNRIKAGKKGGKAGQWSARKAQMLAVAYKKAGGGYTS